MASLWPGRLAGAVVALVVASACGAPAAARPAAPPPLTLPAGYTAFDGGKLNFRFGLAPGWQRSGEQAVDGVSFADSSGQVTLLVHVERARSTDLDAATGVVMFELTAGDGAPRAGMSATRLAGLRARWVRGDSPRRGPASGSRRS